jgi:hypothetical protein
MNPLISEFALLHLLPDPLATVALHELAAAWEAWTAARGVQPGHLMDLVRGLMALGVARPVDPVTGSFVLVGARLRRTP